MIVIYDHKIFIVQATGDNNCLSAIDIREYVDCSLARPACLVLVEWLCHQPPFSRGPTIRCKRSRPCPSSHDLIGTHAFFDIIMKIS